MKQYKEIHYQRGNDESGAFAWVEPKEVRIVTLEDKHAEDVNAQFANTGVKLLPETEIVDGIEMVNHLVDEATLEANPEMKEQGVNVGDVIQYAAYEEDDNKLAEKSESESEKDNDTFIINVDTANPEQPIPSATANTNNQ
jgi:hypothetical protein